MTLATRSSWFRIALGALALLASAVTPWSAEAKPPKHCRDIELNGAAGAASQDVVKFRVRDSTGTLLDESCTLQVRYGESALEFTQRMPSYWGFTAGSSCPILPAPGPTPAPGPIPRLNKTCSYAGNGYACKHEFRSKKGVHSLRICCWKQPLGCNQADGSCCSGTKIDKVDKNLCTNVPNVGNPCTINANCDTSLNAGDGRCGRGPITIQTKVLTNPYSPTDSNVPFTGVAAAQLVVDPIGIVQRPPAGGSTCRDTLGKAMAALASGRINTLVKCEFQDLMGGPGTCDLVQRDEILTKLEATFRAAVTKSCEPLGPPRRAGYATCPAPCNSIAMSTCTAGTVGQPCDDDSVCDTAPGQGDGHCGAGTWDATRDCMVCLAEDTTDTAVDEAFGNVVGPVSPEAEQCQVAVGKVLADVVGGQVKTNAACQKDIDGAKKPLVFCEKNNVCTGPPHQVGMSCATNDTCLPPDAQLCKYADPKGARTGTELSGRDHILQACGGSTQLSELDSCGADPIAEADCIIEQGRIVGQTLSDAVFPEGIGHIVP